MISNIECFVCGEPLTNVLQGTGNQPLDGLEFFTYGHYGSTVFDPMDGTALAIDVCDSCLMNGQKKGRVYFSKANGKFDPENYQVWKGK